MQQRTRHRRSDPCVREPTVRWEMGTLSHLLSVPGRSPHPPPLPWPSCGGGRPPSRLQRLKKGSSWPLLWQEGSEGRSLQRVQWSQISSVAGSGGTVQWEAGAHTYGCWDFSEATRGFSHLGPGGNHTTSRAEVCWDHRYLDVCAMD